MGLLDVLNGMQNGPRGPGNPNAQDKGGISPITMAILALLAYKACGASARPLAQYDQYRPARRR